MKCISKPWCFTTFYHRTFFCSSRVIRLGHLSSLSKDEDATKLKRLWVGGGVVAGQMHCKYLTSSSYLWWSSFFLGRQELLELTQVSQLVRESVTPHTFGLLSECLGHGVLLWIFEYFDPKLVLFQLPRCTRLPCLQSNFYLVCAHYHTHEWLS